MDTPGEQSPPKEFQTPDAITLSEERLRVSLPVRISGRVRLVKYIETETVTQTVEVRREKLRIEESDEPSTDGTDQGPALAGAAPYDWQQDEFEVILHEEQVEIIKRVVAVETVRVRTRIITTDQAVSADLGREQIELVSEPGPVSTARADRP